MEPFRVSMHSGFMSGFLIRPWPGDLPASCPKCSREFETRINLAVGPARSKRRFMKFLYWGMAAWGVGSWPLLVIILHVLGPGQGLGIAMVVYFLLPVFLLGPFVFLLPNCRRVRCFKCDFDQDYRLPKLNWRLR